MIIRTRVFSLGASRYRNLSELASAMGLSISQVYRVREGKRPINQKFIVGAKRAFPDCGLDQLFYLEPAPTRTLPPAPLVEQRYSHIVSRYANAAGEF